VILTRTNVITTLINGISTRTRVIYTRRVWFWHEPTKINVRSSKIRIGVWLAAIPQAQVWLLHHASDCGTLRVFWPLMRVISIRTRMISSRRVWFWHVWVWLRHVRVWFTHARVDFQLDTCDFKTNQLKLTWDHQKIRIGFWLAAIPQARVWFSHLYVWFLHLCVTYHLWVWF
jgi:hypothetical protein